MRLERYFSNGYIIYFDKQGNMYIPIKTISLMFHVEVIDIKRVLDKLGIDRDPITLKEAVKVVNNLFHYKGINVTEDRLISLLVDLLEMYRV